MFSLSETRCRRFVGIIVTVTAIRVAAANQGPLSEVDCFSWRITTYSVPLLLEHLQRDTHPPLYYLILKGWVKVAGSSPAAMRGLSVFLGLLGLLVVWILCAEIEGPASTGPHIAVLVAAVHSLQVDAATSVR